MIQIINHITNEIFTFIRHVQNSKESSLNVQIFDFLFTSIILTKQVQQCLMNMFIEDMSQWLVLWPMKGKEENHTKTSFEE